LTLIIAQFEIDLLIKYFKIDAGLLLYFPILFKANEWELKAVNLDFHKRRNFVFIGNFWHEPNWDAVLYLKKVIWPSIRMMMPSAELYIYGAYPSQKVFDLHNKKQGFHVMGRADSSEIVISEARVLLAPLRFGAGIKGKLLEAMQYGTPSVTTQIGAESINDNFDWSGFVADIPDEFASKATLLYQDEILWRQAQAKGTLILQNRFCFGAFEPVFKIKLDDLLLNLAKHRKFNFIGGLLNHQTMKSTEYMSRWIEEKNKK
jgi:glycosyltransferase involved in cell wall biosynthesis